MFHLVDTGLERHLRAATPLHSEEVDVAFVAPDRRWAATVSRPTVNLFLWDVVRSEQHARSGTEVVERDGQLRRRIVPPCFALHYLVTAWTAEVRDEHQLLGSLLAALLRTDALPADFLPDPLNTQRPLPALRVGVHPDAERRELWSAVDGQLKPALDLTVVAVVDPDLTFPLAPPVDSLRLTVRSRPVDAESTGAVRVEAPRAAAGQPATRWRRWLQRGRAGDELVGRAAPRDDGGAPARGRAAG